MLPQQTAVPPLGAPLTGFTRAQPAALSGMPPAPPWSLGGFLVTVRVGSVTCNFSTTWAALSEAAPSRQPLRPGTAGGCGCLGPREGGREGGSAAHRLLLGLSVSRSCPLLCPVVAEKRGAISHFLFLINYQRVNLVNGHDARAGYLPKWHYCF